MTGLTNNEIKAKLHITGKINEVQKKYNLSDKEIIKVLDKLNKQIKERENVK